MAVISELIDAGLGLKQQGNHQAAIVHFQQLNAVYPDHARILFELADSWQAFGVPEQALPLYRQLTALPESRGLPPKDVPRLYTQMGAALLLLDQFTESLAIIDEGLRRYPAYRPLRAYRMFALHRAGLHQDAMVESLELMIESLAPSKWDAFEADIVQMVKALRGRMPDLKDEELDEDETSEADVSGEDDAMSMAVEPVDASPAAPDRIAVADEDELIEDLELEVKVRRPPPKSRKGQFGRKPIQIDISFDPEASDDVPASADEDSAPPNTGRVMIPIDFD